MKKPDIKISLLLAFLGFIAGVFLVPKQFASIKETSPDQYKQIVESIPFSIEVLYVISAVQILVISFILSLVGLKLARAVGLTFPIFDSLFTKGERVKFDNRATILALIFGFVTSLVMVVSDKFVFKHFIPKLAESEKDIEFSLSQMLAGVFYGGVTEEVMLRLFFMSLLVFIFMKVSKKTKETTPNTFYWLALTIAAVLFGLGHLPATQAIFGDITPIIIVRAVLLNGIGAVFFGYLYWKKGLEYSIISHMFTHVSLQLIMIPLFY